MPVKQFPLSHLERLLEPPSFANAGSQGKCYLSTPRSVATRGTKDEQKECCKSGRGGSRRGWRLGWRDLRRYQIHMVAAAPIST